MKSKMINISVNHIYFFIYIIDSKIFIFKKVNDDECNWFIIFYECH